MAGNHGTHAIVIPRIETQTYHNSRLDEQITLSIYANRVELRRKRVSLDVVDEQITLSIYANRVELRRKRVSLDV